MMGMDAQKGLSCNHYGWSGKGLGALQNGVAVSWEGLGGKAWAELSTRLRRPPLPQESLGGNSRTCIIANVTPDAASAWESHSTLAFAAGAKKIRCRAVVNEDRGGDARALAAENARLLRALGELQARLAGGGGQEAEETEAEETGLSAEAEREVRD